MIKSINIGDPCETLSNKKLPNEIDKMSLNVKSKNKPWISRWYKGNLTGKGRLVLVLYQLGKWKKVVDESLDLPTGTKRLYSDPNNLQYGMGNIFEKRH